MRTFDEWGIMHSGNLISRCFFIVGDGRIGGTVDGGLLSVVFGTIKMTTTHVHCEVGNQSSLKFTLEYHK